MAKRDQILALYELADRKGYDVTQSTMRDHVRLIGPDGNLGGAQLRRGTAVFGGAAGSALIDRG